MSDVNDDTEQPASRPEDVVLWALLSKEFPGSFELRAQAEVARVERDESSGSPFLRFYFDHGVQVAPVVQRIPVEGHFGEEDGQRIHCLLHVVNGVLEELEFFREDGAPIPMIPPVDGLRITVNF